MKQMVRNLLGLCVGILMLVQPWGIRAEENGPPIQTIKLVAVGDIMMHKEEIEGGKCQGQIHITLTTCLNILSHT